jgi:cytochrome c oxidase accessory protein FixG
MSREPAPTLDKLAILDDQGFRKKLHPADTEGRIQRLKPFVRWALIGFFVLLPWIEVGGHPAVLFDLPARRLFLMGHSFGTGDLPFLFFTLISIGWSLVVLTTLFGRVWCGWGCPQTVYLEAVFRRIERVIEGNGHQRLAFDMAPWTASKAAKKLLKWSLWMVASFLIGHVFLSYFVSLPRVAQMVLDDPRENWGAFVVATFVTLITYANFAWFREQVCLIICPYGRLQSSMHDRDSIIVGYDVQRGEPRGKKSDDGSTGDCVDCRRCVQVCPTGIDIRNGLQMECIGCAACVDACDAVMIKIGKPKGLVRYDSAEGFATGTRRILRPRVFYYAFIGVVFATIVVVFAATRTPFVARIVWPRNLPFQLIENNARVQNMVMVHVENRSSAPMRVHVEHDESSGAELTSPMKELTLQPQERGDLPLLVRMPVGKARPGFAIPLRVVDDQGRSVEATVLMLAPMPGAVLPPSTSTPTPATPTPAPSTP